MSNTINKENAVKECSRALCNDAQETLSAESNAAAQDTYVACGCNTLAKDIGRVAAAAGTVAGAFYLSKMLGDAFAGEAASKTAEQLMLDAEVAIEKGQLENARLLNDLAARMLTKIGDMERLGQSGDLNNRINAWKMLLNDLDAKLEGAGEVNNLKAALEALGHKLDIYKEMRYIDGTVATREMIDIIKAQKTAEQTSEYAQELMDKAGKLIKKGQLGNARLLNDIASRIFVKTGDMKRLEQAQDQNNRIRAWQMFLNELDVQLEMAGEGSDPTAVRKILEEKLHFFEEMGCVDGIESTKKAIEVTEAQWAAMLPPAEEGTKGLEPKPVKAERPDIETAKAADIGGKVLATLKSWHEIAENMTDGGSPEQLDAASRRFEMTAHVMEAFGYVHGAGVAYEQAAIAIFAKSPLDTAELERMASLYEAATCDPEYADANFSKAGKYWFDAAQAWAKTGNITQALGDLDRAKKAYKISNGSVEKETVLKMGVLEANLMRELSEKAPSAREHYQVSISLDVIEAYLQKRYGREWNLFGREDASAKIMAVAKAVRDALKNHELEMSSFIVDVEGEGRVVSLKGCEWAIDLYDKKNTSRGAPSRGPAVAAGVEGVARAAKSTGAERREALEKAGKGPEKKAGQEEGRKGPDVRGRP